MILPSEREKLNKRLHTNWPSIKMNYSIFFSNKDAKLGKINDANELFLHEYELCLTFVDKNSFFILLSLYT